MPPSPLHGVTIPRNVSVAKLPDLMEIAARSERDALVVMAELRRRYLRKQEKRAQRATP
jgi:hypothetical protein